MRFPLTRADAVKRWRAFLPQAGGYAAVRNHVRLDHDNVSCLSPALRLRVILEDEIVTETLQYHAFAKVEKWLQEVCWRRYWKGWLEMRPQVWRQYRAALRVSRTALTAEQKVRLAAIESGQGGIGIMDRFAKELNETGYLHNHARMWFASYWIHVEKLPWELGADFFFRHLLDADPASNTLSWRWVAGLQTRGKTYLVRRSNLEKYCEAELLRDESGLDRLEDGRITPVTLTETADVTAARPLLYASQVPELPKRYGLWVHPDDLCPELGRLGELHPVSIAAFTSLGVYAHYGLGVNRVHHLTLALRDAVNRARTHFAVPGEVAESATTAEGLADWVRKEELNAVIAYAPFVGPVADALPMIRRRLGEASCQLHLIRRQSDLEVLPLARAGFFPFWEGLKKRMSSDHSG